MWVKFNSDFDWRLPSSTLAYMKGRAYSVTRSCADEAISKGKAVRIPTPKKGEPHGEATD